MSLVIALASDGTTTIRFDSSDAHVFKAYFYNGRQELPHIWTPTLYRLAASPRWVEQAAFRGPIEEIKLPKAVEWFRAHGTYYRPSPWPEGKPPRPDANERTLYVGFPDILLRDLEAADVAEVLKPKRRRLRRDEIILKICAALDSLAGRQEWGATEERIYTLAGVSKSTYFTNRDHEQVKNKFEEYMRKGRGRGPTSINAL
jgi:hypothetical protein